jgi:hypothetical protein
MLSERAKAVAEKASNLYKTTLREELERTHFGAYVCIEPASGEYFLGRSFDEAANAAMDAYPDRSTHTLRIGHAAALHLGVLVQ